MNIIEEIKARVKMTDVLSLYGVHPFRGTNIYKCIVHQPDKKPSANINKQNGKFHCFACGWTGDIFDIVKHFEGCDTKKAMQIVDERFGLSLWKELTPKEKRELKRKIKQMLRQVKPVVIAQ